MTVAAATSRRSAGGTGASRREELLDAADRIVQRDGPEASMAAIAAEAGITKPILYRHFGDKSGLFRALAERHTDQLLARLRAGLLTRGPRRLRVRTTIDAYLAEIEAQPEVYRFLLHRAALEEPAVHGQVTLFVRRLGDELAAGIAVELGLDDEQLAQAWGHAVVGMVQSAGDWWLERRTVSRDRLADQLTDLLMTGFAGE